MHLATRCIALHAGLQLGRSCNLAKLQLWVMTVTWGLRKHRQQ